MRTIYVGVIAVVLCLVGCSPTSPEWPSVAVSSQAAVPDPKAFLDRLYSHYGGADSAFSPMGTRAAQWFDAEMAALMTEDARLSNGEVGALDADPVCDCQDYGKLSANIKIEQVTTTTARAQAVITETDTSFTPDARQPRTLTYSLVLENGEWRIHDIGTKSIPSLHDWLAGSNAEASSG